MARRIYSDNIIRHVPVTVNGIGELREIWRDVVRKRLSSRAAKEVIGTSPVTTTLAMQPFFVASTHGGLVSAENRLLFFDI